MEKEIEIEGRKIGKGYKPYIICELSGNHNGSLEKALKLVDEAAKSGADAIKIQTYTPDTMTIQSDLPDFQITSGLWNGYSLYDLYQEAHTPLEWHKAIFERANEHGITIFSTPFDETAVDFLENLDVPAYKIASFEVTDLELIAYVAQKGKPMIISTGLANIGEINDAVSTARKNGCDELVLLHCVSSYPAPPEQSNLRTIANLSNTFSVVTGLSDHTLGTATAIASISLGAAVVEKHFTLARKDGGPDAEFSLEPNEFKGLCRDCQDAWNSLGLVTYEQMPAEKASMAYRRSLYVIKKIKRGETFTRDNVKRIRPGFGLPPSAFKEILGRKAKTDLDMGVALKREHIE
jgi:pseudaminic acid synthase